MQVGRGRGGGKEAGGRRREELNFDRGPKFYMLRCIGDISVQFERKQ